MRRAGIRRTGQKLVAFLLVVLLVFPMMVPAQAKAATTLMGKEHQRLTWWKQQRKIKKVFRE